VNPCETCLDLDARMKATESDEEWNDLFTQLEQHRFDAHIIHEDDIEKDSNGGVA